MTPWGARVYTVVSLMALAGSLSAAPQKPLVKPPPGRVEATPAPAEGPRIPAGSPSTTPPATEAPAAAAPTTPEGRLALARTRVVELHVARISWVLEECRRVGTLDEARAAALRAALPAALDREVVASWYRPTPAELGLFDIEIVEFADHDEGPAVAVEDAVVEFEIAGEVHVEHVEPLVHEEPVLGIAAAEGDQGGQDIAHSTLRDWLSSEAWPALLTAHLTLDEVLAVQQAFTARSTAVIQAEAAFLEARLARGLCLTNEERLVLRGPLEAFVRSRPHDVVATARSRALSARGELDELRSLRKHPVTEALSKPRREALSGLQKGVRRTEDDLAVEIEHLVTAHGKSDRERELLRGFAQTLVERSVVRKKVLPGRGILAPVTDLNEVDLWSKGLRGVLDLPDDTEFAQLPSRLLTPVCETRADFLLAVLDELAYLGAEQRVAARSILLRFVLLEANDKRSEDFNIAVVPLALGLRCDGKLEQQRALDDDTVSAEQRALVTGLHALLTPAQREVALR